MEPFWWHSFPQCIPVIYSPCVNFHWGPGLPSTEFQSNLQRQTRQSGPMKREETMVRNFVEEEARMKIQQRKKTIIPTLQELQNSQKGIPRKYWSVSEDRKLINCYQRFPGEWDRIAACLPDRNEAMCYSRYRRLILGKKKHWSEESDEKIKELVDKLGFQWKAISEHIPDKSPKQIREHYLNFLRPNILKTDWTAEEDLKICKLVQNHGRRWKSFQKQLPGRTQNQIKGRYYGHLKRILDEKVKTTKINQASELNSDL